jgi:folate-binding protein YgfZ
MSETGITATPVRLANLGLLRFRGADAAAFLQGQVSNDTGTLAQGSTVRCAYSTPQGRVIAVLTLIPHSSGILALLPLELADSTAQRLAKFILRSKVRIEDVSAEFSVAGQRGPARIIAAGLAVPAAAGGYVESREIGVARVAGDDSRFWIVGPTGGLSGLLATAGDVPGDPGNAWRLADIRAGLPQVYRANSEEFVAQMLNLDLVAGISFTKGCYTGQEIVARTQHLGRIKRRMFRVSISAGAAAPGDPVVGATVRLADGRSGRICECARCDAGLEALAVLPLEPAGDPAGTTGIAATLLDLPYSLA